MVFDGSAADRRSPCPFPPDDLRSVWRYLLVGRQFAQSVSAILERYVCPVDAAHLAAWASGLAHGQRAGRAEWLVLTSPKDRDVIGGVLLVALPFLSNLRALDIPVVGPVVQRRLADVVGAMPSLRDVCWWDWGNSEDPRTLVGLDALLVGRSAALRALVLQDVELAAAVALPDVQFNVLRELNVQRWQVREHEHVVRLLRSVTAAAPQLRALILECGHAWAGQDLVEVVQPRRSSLRALSLDVASAAGGDASSPAFGDQSAMAVILAACTALQTLQISTMRWLDRECLRGAALRRLESLAIVRGTVAAADLLRLGGVMSSGKLRRLVLPKGAVDLAGGGPDRLDAFIVRQVLPARAEHHSTCASLMASTSTASRFATRSCSRPPATSECGGCRPCWHAARPPLQVASRCLYLHMLEHTTPTRHAGSAQRVMRTSDAWLSDRASVSQTHPARAATVWAVRSSAV